MSAEIELERLGLVPSHVREFVLERDCGLCRVCGQYAGDPPALHHIQFRSQGGLDVPSNLITIGWENWHNCHLEVAHGPQARTWREIFLAIAEQPGVTALQLARWSGFKPGF